MLDQIVFSDHGFGLISKKIRNIPRLFHPNNYKNKDDIIFLHDRLWLKCIVIILVFVIYLIAVLFKSFFSLALTYK